MNYDPKPSRWENCDECNTLALHKNTTPEPSTSKKCKQRKLAALTPSRQVKPSPKEKKQKLPRENVYMKRIKEVSSYTAVDQKDEKDSTKETLEEDAKKTPADELKQLKATAMELVQAAEKLCKPKENTAPGEPAYISDETVPMSVTMLKQTYFLPETSLPSYPKAPPIAKQESKDEEEELTVHQKILREMAGPVTVTKEHVLGLNSAFVKLISHKSTKEFNQNTFQKKMKQNANLEISKLKNASDLNCHEFCTENAEFQIPPPFTKAAWKYHTPNRYITDFPIRQCRESVLDSMRRGLPDDTITSAMIMECNFEVEITQLKETSERMFCKLHSCIKTDKAPTMCDDSIYYWSLSPPKLNVMPFHVKQTLFHQYGTVGASELFSYRAIARKNFIPNFSLLAKHKERVSLPNFLNLLDELIDFSDLESSTESEASLHDEDEDEDEEWEESGEDIDGRPTGRWVRKGRRKESSRSRVEGEDGAEGKVKGEGEGEEEAEDAGKEEGLLSATPESKDKGDLKGMLLKDTQKMTRLTVKSTVAERSWEISQRFFDNTLRPMNANIRLGSAPNLLQGKLSRMRGRADSKRGEWDLFGIQANLNRNEAIWRARSLVRKTKSELTYFRIKDLEARIERPEAMEFEEWIINIWLMWRSEYSPEELQNAKKHINLYEDIGLPQVMKLTFSPREIIATSYNEFLKIPPKIEIGVENEEVTALAIDSTWPCILWHMYLINVFQGRYEEAILPLANLEHIEKSYRVYMCLGLTYAKLGKIAQATSSFSLAVSCRPKDEVAYLFQAQLHLMNGEPTQALDAYESLLHYYPRDVEILFRFASTAQQIGFIERALTGFNRLIDVSIRSLYFLRRAQLYLKLNNFQAALNDLCDAIHLNPDSWEAYYLRGTIIKRSNEERAVTDFSLSLLLNEGEDNLDSLIQRAFIYDKQENVYPAICDLLQLIKIFPHNLKFLLRIGHLYTNLTETPAKALEYYAKAIEIAPNNIECYFSRGLCYLKLEEYQLALRDFSFTIHIKPDHYKCFIHLGYVVLKLEKFKLSQDFLALVGPNYKVTGIGNRTEFAKVQMYLGDCEAAIDIIGHNLVSDPSSIPLLELLGKAQSQDYRYRKALQTYFLMKDFMEPKKKGWPAGSDNLFFNIAMTHMKLEEYTEALAAFNQVIRINKSHNEALYYRGIVKVHLNMVDFIKDFNKALCSSRRSARIYLSRACYFGLLKNYPKAILNCNEALLMEPKNIRGYLYRGSLKYFLKSYKFAVKDFTAAMKINPNIAVLYLNRGICYAKMNHTIQALRDYAIGLLIGGNLDYKLYVNRGLIYFNLHDITNAYFDFMAAVRLYGGDHCVFHILGLIMHSLGKYEPAIKVLTRCIILEPTFELAFISRANIYMDYVTPHYHMARCDYQRAIRLNPVNCLAYVSLGIFLQVRQEFQMAYKVFSAAISIDPSYQAAYEARGILNLQMQENYPAFQDFTVALRFGATAELYNNRGVVNQIMESPAAALRDYYKAIEIDRTFALAYFNAGTLHLKGRFFKQAYTYLNRSIMLDPRDECAYINRAIAKGTLKDSKGALQDFEKSLTLSPYYIHTYYNRACLYMSLKEYAKAEEDFTSALKILPHDVSILMRRAEARKMQGKNNMCISDYRIAIRLMSLAEEEHRMASQPKD
ncbi:hypothetical protein Ahia01_000442500 [Argonauta hians]